MQRFPIALVLTALCIPALAAPVSYTFMQPGFSGGAVRGSFLGNDLDGNGTIDSTLGEVSQFRFDWSPTVTGPFMTFNGQFSYEVIFRLPEAAITDASGAVDLVALFGPSRPGAPLTPCLVNTVCTYIGAVNGASGVNAFSKITATPEPGPLALFGLGVAVLGRHRRRG